MEKITLNRKQLYDLIWSESLLSLSKKYNISDVGLRKACQRMGIPLPKAGHWAKVQHGLNPTIDQFSETHYGQSEVTLYFRDAEHPATIEGLTPIAAMQQIMQRDYAQELVVKKELTNPDPIIVSAQKTLLKRNKYYKDGDILYTESGQLNIRVSDKQITRALCLMDAVVKIMQKRGHGFKVRNNSSYLIIGNEEIEISLREMGNLIISDDRWQSRSSQPNGKLELKFSHYSKSTTGKDGKEPIEQQLAKIIARVELMADELRVQEEENRIWRVQHEEKERLRKENAERKKLELASFKEALKEADRWQEAFNFRNYIAAVENKAMLSGNLSDEIHIWIEWAKKKADWYDPLIEISDDWLDEIDRTKIRDAESVRSEFSLFSGHQENFTVEKPKWPLLPWYLKNK